MTTHRAKIIKESSGADKAAPPIMATNTVTVELIPLEERVKSFNSELAELLKKYRLNLGAQPFFNPDGTTGAKPVVVDVTSNETANT